MTQKNGETPEFVKFWTNYLKENNLEEGELPIIIATWRIIARDAWNAGQQTSKRD